jgi:putative heme-binding domain-containing protein
LAQDPSWRASAPAREIAEQIAAEVGARGSMPEVEQILKAVEAAKDDHAIAGAILRGLGHGFTGGLKLWDVVPPGSGAERALTELVEQARRTAGDERAAPAARVDAIQLLLLGSFAGSRDLLTRLLDARQPEQVQRAAIAVLGRYSDSTAGEILVKAWPSLSPRLRTAAADVIFSRPAGATAFLDAVDARKIAASDVELSRLRPLESADDNALALRAKKLMAALSRGRRDDVVVTYRAALERKGDPAKGKAIFQKTCATCHRLEGFGHEIGPNLVAMQNRGAEAVLVNVLDPNREVNPQFLNYIVVTTDGRTLTGMLAAETANSVTLKRAEGATDTVLRTNIKQMRGDRVSIMPEGLEQQIDQQAMADLIAYVMSAK